VAQSGRLLCRLLRPFVALTGGSARASFHGQTGPRLAGPGRGSTALGTSGSGFGVGRLLAKGEIEEGEEAGGIRTQPGLASSTTVSWLSFIAFILVRSRGPTTTAKPL